MTRPLVLLVQALVLLVAPAPVKPEASPQGTAFARLIEQLSEPGGYFDSDNLVSNETSYLHVLPALRTLGVRGGAYLGVGPEQSFSYIAEIKPELAILIDIRRDNLLLHLLFKAMFETARNRMEYLCLLYGRPAPQVLAKWAGQPLEDILTYLDITPGDPAVHARNHAALMERVTRVGYALADSDRATLRRFHDEFYQVGLDITFTSRGRPPRPGYPTERQLYLATDLDGNRGSYLSTEERFRTIQNLHRLDRIVPAVGDLSGPGAVKAIAKYLRERNLSVSAFYVSNVEMYLFRAGTFPRFAENVRALPAADPSVLIRSYFGRGMWNSGGSVAPFPVPAAGHLSAQQLQTFGAFLEITAQPEQVTYWDILTGGVVDLRTGKPPLRQQRRRWVRSGRGPAEWPAVRPSCRPAVLPSSRPAVLS
ncbi:MAG: LIC_10091 family protein [Gemmatimonadales bacterium]